MQSSWVVLWLPITDGSPLTLRNRKVWDCRLMHLECLFIWVWYTFILELGKVVLGALKMAQVESYEFFP